MRKLTTLIMTMALTIGTVHAAEETLTPSPAEKKAVPVPLPMLMPKAGHPMGMHEMFKGLNLTESQKQQMRAITSDARKEMRRPSPDDRRAMYDIIAADNFDRTKAEVQATKMANEAQEHTLKIMETQNKLYNVLTPEQKKQFKQNAEKRLAAKAEFETRPR